MIRKKWLSVPFFFFKKKKKLKMEGNGTICYMGIFDKGTLMHFSIIKVKNAVPARHFFSFLLHRQCLITV